uniref:Uncharacterized protein n=1 Tax=Oryza barthii TaxID=65489 RepID=A0A0D3HAV5_9ORYZ
MAACSDRLSEARRRASLSATPPLFLQPGGTAHAAISSSSSGVQRCGKRRRRRRHRRRQWRRSTRAAQPRADPANATGARRGASFRSSARKTAVDLGRLLERPYSGEPHAAVASLSPTQ